MYERETKLPVPDDFSFPFPPYEIQKQLMREHFRVLEDKRIGIFESPTGTGKTLTLICSALTWLIQHEKSLNEELNQKISDLKRLIQKHELETNASSDWITAQYETLQEKQKLAELKTEMDNLEKYYKEIKEFKSKTSPNLLEKYNSRYTDTPIESPGDDDFLLEESDETEETDASEEEKFSSVKIYFCSRTHSQLSQVVSEVKRTVFKETRVVSLASRQNYCINDSVMALKSNSLINERCLEMQKNKGSAVKKSESKKQKVQDSARCPFYNQSSFERLRNESLAKIMDIEELATVGKQHKACPYYSSRLASVHSQLILVPYQMILHKRTREQLGINIKNSVVIIDEAHNLLDTISAIYSAEIKLEELQKAKEYLELYRQKYMQRFSPNTVLKLKQLIFVAKSLISVLKGKESKMLKVPELISEAELFEINLPELLKFAENSRLAQKVHGFAISEEKRKHNEPTVTLKPGPKTFLKSLENNPAQKVQEEAPKVQEVERSHVSNVIRPFLTLLEALLNDSDDGRVLISEKSCQHTMKYLILNPGAHFQEIIASCQALTLAGGTMQPVNEVIEQLFHVHKDRLHVSCFGHVVSRDAVVALAVRKGPTGKALFVNWTNRNTPELMQDLASSIQNICMVVPAGVVCFFPSYNYIDEFYKYLTENKLLDRLKQKKVLVVENRKSQADILLEQYSTTIRRFKNNAKGSPNGALLFSVVGGKLSEGLNFSDDLGRCVVVIGLPFPNNTDPELLERRKYLNEHLHATAGTEYYTNLCMKAVNQCIGRAVRHINDYASVVLLDIRYAQPQIQTKLPTWIQRSLQNVENFGQAQHQLVTFFKSKQRTA